MNYRSGDNLEFSDKFVCKLSALLKAYSQLDSETKTEEHSIWVQAVDNLLDEELN